MSWTLADIPDLTGKRALVTGVTSGIGEATALELARRGAEVILGARSRSKLDTTVAGIVAAVPTARLQCVIIDVSELASVRRTAAQASTFGPLDLLVNNAGVMATPYARTGDGFELQMATNYFGPFALTGLLLPQLVASGNGRVVSVASHAHRMARSAPLDDPRVQGGRYSRWDSYAKSKLADLLFMYELDRRLREQELPVKVLAAHPGYASTHLVQTGVNAGGTKRHAEIMQGVFGLLGQSAGDGALPTLMAATADLAGSTYVGPGGRGQMRGLPKIVQTTKLARDRDAQRKLWELSENATGVRYP
jgi:NAD(P)-dependent dehydrogenase (short-subunit alcohol dehydrogenase family)